MGTANGKPIRTVAAILLGLGTAVVACEEPRDAYGGPGGYGRSSGTTTSSTKASSGSGTSTGTTSGSTSSTGSGG